ncbi:MAG: transcriptional repressor [Phycisphaerae bacterium]|nr:transcriptional repressor [Phycisphaerae bacterium]
MTPQRQAVLDAVRDAPEHLTADEVYARVRAELPRISLGTVYRSLEELVHRGLIGRVQGGGAQRRYDRSTDVHCHARCLACGRVDDTDVEGVDLRKLVASRVPGYRVVGCGIELVGYCPRCVKAGHAEPRG